MHLACCAPEKTQGTQAFAGTHHLALLHRSISSEAPPTSSQVSTCNLLPGKCFLSYVLQWCLLGPFKFHRLLLLKGSCWRPAKINRAISWHLALDALCQVSPPALTPSRPFCTQGSGGITAASWYANMYQKPNSRSFTSKATSLPANADGSSSPHHPQETPLGEIGNFSLWQGKGVKGPWPGVTGFSDREEKEGALAGSDLGITGKVNRMPESLWTPPTNTLYLVLFTFPTFSLKC